MYSWINRLSSLQEVPEEGWQLKARYLQHSWPLMCKAFTHKEWSGWCILASNTLVISMSGTGHVHCISIKLFWAEALSQPWRKKSDHLICLLRNLYAGQEATVRTGHGTTDWFQIGKGLCQGYILSPYLFNLYAEYIMKNAGLDEAQTGIKISWRNIKTTDMQMTPLLWQKAKN